MGSMVKVASSGGGIACAWMVGSGKPAAATLGELDVQLGGSPRLFHNIPQSPVTPLQRAADGPSVFNQILMNEQQEDTDGPPQKIIPTLLEWTLGRRNVYVEGSWKSWKSKTSIEKSGKDHTIFLGLPSGVYRYRFVVDGERRFLPDLPCETDNMGNTVNLLDVNEFVSESLENVSELMAPPRTLATVSRLLTRSSQRSLMLCQRSSTSVCSKVVI